MTDEKAKRPLADAHAAMPLGEVLKILDSYFPMVSAVGMAGGGSKGSRAMSEAHRKVMRAVADAAKRETALAKRVAELEQRDMMLTEQTVLYAAERDAWRAKVEALRADAERYRWMRRIDSSPIHVFDLTSAETADASIYGDELDAAIDTARRPLQAGAR